MRKLLLGIFCTIPSVFASTPNIIEANKVSSYVDQHISVCGQVAQVKKGKTQTYLNIGEKYPNQKITFLIWDSDLEPFQEKFISLHKLNHQKICAKGKITQYKKQFQLAIFEPENLWLSK